MNYVALAIPAFFLFLGLEYVIALLLRKSHFFKFESSVANMTVGIAERVLTLFITTGFYGLFGYIYRHVALFKIPNHWTVWILIVLFTDLVWYWYHRLGHEINLFWAAHVVHHQSDEFNFTVSARITTFQAIIRNSFWCILPLAGFHPDIVFTTLLIHGTYSFFTHTRLVGKLGWLEYIFITPSHHGVHHASNEKYLNKNYGDLFIFWDKLFGTFQKEEETPSYGLTHPLKSHSFIWQHFHYFLELAEAVRRAKGLHKKLALVFGRPESIDQSVRIDLEKLYLSQRVAKQPTMRFKAYLIAQLILLSLLVFLVSLYFFQLTAEVKFFTTLLVLVSLVNCGALLEQRKWIYYLEYIRLILICTHICYRLNSLNLFFITTILIVIFISSPSPRKMYLKFVYDN
jgi:alkylglycerol monooxygenase